jgi:phospholipid/cholesterol/gamma-HCH transport system substrate-binding protein
VSGAARKLGIDPRAVVGLVVLLAGAALWGFAFLGGSFSPFGSKKTEVKADFSSVQYVVANDPVRINGVQVGRVSKSDPDPGGAGGTLTFELDEDAGTIYKDASASIRWRTALGANEAVALTPGTPSAGKLGDGTIPQSQTTNQVELDQIAQTFHGDAQPGIQTMLKELGPAFADHEQLGEDLQILTDVGPNAAVGIGALRGQVRDTDLRELIVNASQAAQALDVGTDAETTQRLVESAATTLDAIDPTDLRLAVQRAAAVLEPSEVMFAHLDKILYKVDPLVPKLSALAPDATSTLGELRPLVTELHGLLTDADPLLRSLRPAVHSLEDAARVGVPAINELEPSLDRLSTDVLPGLEQVYPEEDLPVYKLIGPTIVGLGTLSNFFDQNGELANLTAGLEEPQAAQILPCQLDFSGTNFIVCTSLSDALSVLFGGPPSLLRKMAATEVGAPIYGPMLEKALEAQDRLDADIKKLKQVRPQLAKWLFELTKKVSG